MDKLRTRWIPAALMLTGLACGSSDRTGASLASGADGPTALASTMSGMADTDGPTSEDTQTGELASGATSSSGTDTGQSESATDDTDDMDDTVVPDEWGPVYELEGVTAVAVHPQAVVVDPEGRALALARYLPEGSTGDGQLIAHAFDPAAETWSAPFEVAANVASASAVGTLGGRLLTTWGGSQTRLYTTQSGAWSEMLAMDASLAAGPPHLAISASGMGFITWLEYADKDSITVRSLDTTTNSAQWSEATNVLGADPIARVEGPIIVANERGDAAVLWCGRWDSGACYSSRLNAGSSEWSAPTRVHDYDMQAIRLAPMAMDSLGNTVAVWSMHEPGGVETVFGARFDATLNTWSKPHALATAESMLKSAPALVGSSNGSAIVYWVEATSEAGAMHWASMDGDGVWSSVGTLGGAAGPNMPAHASMDAAGHAVLLAGGDVRSYDPARGVWSEPVLIAEIRPSPPAVWTAIDDHGHVWTTWAVGPRLRARRGRYR